MKKHPFILVDETKHVNFSVLKKDHEAYRLFIESNLQNKFVCQLKYQKNMNTYRNILAYDIGEVVRLKRGKTVDILVKVDYVVVTKNRSIYACIHVYETKNIEFISTKIQNLHAQL